MKKFIYPFSSVLIAIVFLTLAIGSGDSDSSSKQNKISLEDVTSIKEFIKGKWHHQYFETDYRYEITDSHITQWTKSTDGDWEDSNEIYTYSISDVQTSKGEKYREIIFYTEGETKGAVYLTFEHTMFIDNCLMNLGQCMVRGWE